MNAQPRPLLSIRAQYIGPIMKLDQHLSNEKQNLIFARNGTGKSFIARALRMLDESVFPGQDQSEIPDLLVSEEAPAGQGSFALNEGDVCVGNLELNTKKESVSRSCPKYIFHVFSEDYVNEQVRNKLEMLEGKISHQIIVGKENVELDEKEKALAEKKRQLMESKNALEKLFAETREKHKADFSINASLGSYQALNTGNILGFQSSKSANKSHSLSELLAQFNKFKSLPSDPKLPKQLQIKEINISERELQETLSRKTSPSAVAPELKQKINADQHFFERGLSIHQANPQECPFCTQSMSELALNAIGAYSNYFDDQEAKERQMLNREFHALERARDSVLSWRSEYIEAKARLDNLKGYLPSFSQKQLVDAIPAFDELVAHLEILSERVKGKSENLAQSVDMPTPKLDDFRDSMSKIISENNELLKQLTSTIQNSSAERRKIQNTSCSAFEEQFFWDNRAVTEEIHALRKECSDLELAVESLRQRHGETASARDRVIGTFSILLKRFFGNKYSFDGTNFKVRRNNREMLRGGDRTLSDGEKSAMAFCYFLAQTHLRVESNEDYKRVYFVFDDPVTSMSYDYIYSIIQCLRLLRISADGEIQFNLQSDPHRPRMLILTHNAYFFNVASTNRLVLGKALYQLVENADCHDLRSQQAFATPHLLHLKDVVDVSQGKKAADHTTPNSVRSVVEGIWKFCRPDIQNFTEFVKFLISEHDIEIRSVLINDLCHGGKFSDPPHNEEDIRKATEEAVAVVESFAPGQLTGL